MVSTTKLQLAGLLLLVLSAENNALELAIDPLEIAPLFKTFAGEQFFVQIPCGYHLLHIAHGLQFPF